MSFGQYTTASQAELFKILDTKPGGLTEMEVARRHKKNGLNTIESEKVSWFIILARQFKSSFIYLLALAGATSFLLNQATEGIMIIIFVGINVALGFCQEYKSEKNLKILKNCAAQESKVIRNSKEKIVDTRQLAVGDIITFETGDLIGADARILEATSLTIDESALSGESNPVAKQAEVLKHEVAEIYQAKNITFAGTTVTTGSGCGVVIASGKQMQFGRISSLTVKTKRQSAFQNNINKISSFILKLIITTLIVVFIANLAIKGEQANIGELLIFAIALAVSVVPEALPVVTTFSFTRGAVKLAKKKVVVKRLSAIEDLGGIEVLCTDKTGTLTENKMRVAEIYGSDQSQTVWYATLANDSLKGGKQISANAFDLALENSLTATQTKNLARAKKIAKLPFDPDRRRNSALVKINNRRLLIVRGAPEAIIEHCRLTRTNRTAINRWVKQQGQLGRRILTVALNPRLVKDEYAAPAETQNLELIGAISFIDPIKPTAKKAVSQAEELGVDVKILTGDSREVATDVALQVGLITNQSQVITGEELEKMNPAQVKKTIMNYEVFARVSPEQKYRIIQLMQEQKQVGFLGEGINDAPALKIANVAIAVVGAADIAKEAADIILLQKNLNIIIEGISEGRKIFSNTIKYIKSTLASNFGNFFAVASASLLIDFLPMLPLQILLLNLLSDFPMIAVAADNVDPEELKQPGGYNIKDIALLALVLGMVSTIFDFLFFGLFYKISPTVLQTNWFIGSILTELVLIFSIRSKKKFYSATRPSKILFWLTFVTIIITVALPFTTFAQKIFKFTAPNIFHLLMIAVIVLVYFLINEKIKTYYFRLTNNRANQQTI
ncbi:MAG: HAD-IC family P-type ATPase [Patescibacteria group bacterium]|jgi:Mg2+-importing ATPase|nr:HAD-IC family P-type ATPase [Patescibacteria group bacterium]